MSAPVAPPSPRIELSLRNLLLLAAPALAIGLRWGCRMSTAHVTLLVAPLLVFSFSLPSLLRWKARRFERELLRRIQLRQTASLRKLYGRQLFLRLFATSAYLAGRRGMIAQELGEHAVAREAFRAALAGADDDGKVLLLLGLANACYGLEDDAAAEPLYRDVLRRGGRYAKVYHHLAHGLLRRDLKLDEAIEIAEDGLRAVGADPALEGLLVELRERRGSRKAQGKGRRR